MQGIAAEGTTVVVITHDQVLASGFARQIDLLDGAVVSDEVRDVARDPARPGQIEGGEVRPGDVGGDPDRDAIRLRGRGATGDVTDDYDPGELDGDDYDTGEHDADAYVTGDYDTGEYDRDDYDTGDYADDYDPGEYDGDDYDTDNYSVESLRPAVPSFIPAKPSFVPADPAYVPAQPSDVRAIPSNRLRARLDAARGGGR